MAYIDDLHTQQANQKYIRASMQEPLLSREREFDLAQRWREKGEQQALHQLIRAYTRLVIAVASRFRNYGISIGDLLQEGNVGLMQAAFRFEPSRGVRFSTYAGWWIRSAIQDYILRNWSMVRIGSTAAHKLLFFNLNRLCTRIHAVSSSDTLTKEDHQWIANYLKVDVTDVEVMEARLSASDQSLNTPIGNEEDERQNFLVDQRPSPEEIVMNIYDSDMRIKWLNEALSELSEREQIIIRKRQLADEHMTLEQLGKQLKLSKERVRQLEHRAGLSSKLRKSCSFVQI